MGDDGKDWRDYLLDELASFYEEPPRSDYQDGYFDALAYMADHFGVIKIDDGDVKPSRPKLTLIKGGKE